LTKNYIFAENLKVIFWTFAYCEKVQIFF